MRVFPDKPCTCADRGSDTQLRHVAGPVPASRCGCLRKLVRPALHRMDAALVQCLSPAANAGSRGTNGWAPGLMSMLIKCFELDSAKRAQPIDLHEDMVAIRALAMHHAARCHTPGCFNPAPLTVKVQGPENGFAPRRCAAGLAWPGSYWRQMQPALFAHWSDQGPPTRFDADGSIAFAHAKRDKPYEPLRIHLQTLMQECLSAQQARVQKHEQWLAQQLSHEHAALAQARVQALSMRPESFGEHDDADMNDAAEVHMHGQVSGTAAASPHDASSLPQLAAGPTDANVQHSSGMQHVAVASCSTAGPPHHTHDQLSRKTAVERGFPMPVQHFAVPAVAPVQPPPAISMPDDLP